MSPDLSTFRLHRLPVTLKAVLTAFLLLMGIGYVVSVVNLYLTYHLTDGKPELTLEDLKRAFHGQRSKTKLAAKIDGGSMEQYLPGPGEKEQILSWIQDGATEAGYEKVKHIFDENCIRCHNPEGFMYQTPLTTYEMVSDVVKIDRGEPVALWARVAHTHILTMGLMFLSVGLVFAMTALPETLKVSVVSLPFVAVALDFGSRFLTRYTLGFVYLMALSGALIGLSLAVMILTPLFQIWWGRDRGGDG